MKNQVILIGNLGQKPEVKHTQEGTAYCQFRMATNEVYTDPQGLQQDHTEWHSCVAWRKQAEAMAQYLDKGHKVVVQGVLRTSEYQRPGEENPRFYTRIRANFVEFCGPPRGRDNGPEPMDEHMVPQQPIQYQQQPRPPGPTNVPSSEQVTSINPHSPQPAQQQYAAPPPAQPRQQPALQPVQQPVDESFEDDEIPF